MKAESKGEHRNFRKSLLKKNFAKKVSRVAIKKIILGWARSIINYLCLPFHGKFSYHIGADISGQLPKIRKATIFTSFVRLYKPFLINRKGNIFIFFKEKLCDSFC